MAVSVLIVQRVAQYFGIAVHTNALVLCAVAALIVFLLVRDVRRTRKEVREKETARQEHIAQQLYNLYHSAI